ncbi:MAG: ATP-dependent Clp protease ATP-binding subunit ClpX, partial [Acetatifactor sp.]|nr:ATP-dependent Clp protease ATP-binding subunit ClpX [Acetatifactor sp.]
MSDMYREEDENKETGVNEGTDSEKAEDSSQRHSDASKTQNAGKSDNSEYEDVCFICRRPESKAGKMFKLPNNICVCADCMNKTMDAVSQFDYQGMLNNSQFQQELDELTRQGGFPNISFVNLADLRGDGGIPNKQKLKKKKKKEGETPVLNIRDIPAPHKIKASLDEYVVGQEHAKK